MKNSKNTKILTICLSITLILVVFMGFIIYKLYNTKGNLSENISNMNNETNQIEYIELNEKNYNNYPESRVIQITNNNNGTYTIISRVFEEIELPTLSQKEVESLENGKEIQILNHDFKRDNSDGLNDSGYEYVIVSTDTNEQLKFYVCINDDKTATLSYYTDMILGKGTNIYMKAVVDTSVFDSNVSEYSLDEKESDEYTILTYSEEIQFENGEISSFKWTGV